MGRSLVQQVLADFRTAPVSDAVKAALTFLEKLTLLPEDVTADDARAALSAGLSKAALEDAITVCAAFCMIDRVADATGFEVPPVEDFDVGAKRLLQTGYRL